MLIDLVVRVENEREIEAALWGLLAINERLMSPDWPSVYQLGTHYQREPQGREKWATAGYMRANPREGFDCEDLASFQVAWLRVTGRDPGARIALTRVSSGWHVIVARSDGTFEDPSARLGM